MPTWAMIAGMIAQYGLPFVEGLISKWTANPNGVPTAQEWTDLIALSKNTARSQMLAAFARAGIDPTSPPAQVLLAQVPA